VPPEENFAVEHYDPRGWETVIEAVFDIGSRSPDKNATVTRFRRCAATDR
jgi:hypothetical protein